MIKKVIICCLFMCCSASKKNYFETDTKNKIIDFIKSIDKNTIRTINNEILTEMWDGKEELFTYFSSDNLAKIVTSNGGEVSRKEFSSMQSQIKNNPFKKWSEILGRKYFRNKSNKEYKHYISYSIPVFNKTKEWAFVYVEYPNSGELWAYRKIEHEWTRIGTGMIWISDPVITPNQLKSEK